MLHLLRSNSEKSFIDEHIQSCHTCRERFINIKTFYNIFNDEYARPIDHQTFELVRKVEKNNVNMADILLRPQLLDEMPGERHFISEILKHSHTATGNSDPFALKRDQVLIHAIQSLHTHLVTLFLYAIDRSLYSEVSFTIPRISQTYRSDSRGKIELGYTDINCFDKLEIMIVQKQ